MCCNFENVDNHDNLGEQNFQTKTERIPAKPPLYEPDGLLTNKSAPKKPANCLVVKIPYLCYTMH